MKDYIELFVKAADQLGKYAWAAVFAVLFILFTPDDFATRIGIMPIRQTYRAFLWIGLFFCSPIVLGQVVAASHEFVMQPFVDARAKQAAQKRILSRLKTLSPDERRWIQACICFNQQTVVVSITNSIAHALAHKGLIYTHGGHALAIPYTINDTTWEVIQQHRQGLLRDSDRNDPRVQEDLRTFLQGLQRMY